MSKCNEQRCGLCKSIIEGSCLKLKDKTFHVKEHMNCTVRNVLYVLICNGCKEFFIGQTGDKLRNRKTVHEQQIRDPPTRQMPVSKHIDNCCKTQPKFSIFPFYKFQTDDVSARLAKERYFIDVFSPKLNMFYVLCASVYMCFVVTCWERADLLALVCGVFCEFVTFPLVFWVRCGT